MAIDDREKRQSVIGIHYYIAVSPTANVAKDVEWRQQAGYGYSGILAAGGAATSLIYDRRSMVLNANLRR